MLSNERVIQLENDGDRNDVSKFLERVKKLTIFKSNSFHSLNVSNHWNIPSNNQNRIAKGKGPCNNCGGEHYSTYCPHPRDEAKLKKAKEELTACRGSSGRNGGSGSGRQGDRKKCSNNERDGDRNDDGNGVKNTVIIGCTIDVVSSLDGVTTIILDFMPLGSVILALFLPC